jgi:hypothetical protein
MVAKLSYRPLLICLVALSQTTAANADMLVLESNVSDIPSGSQLAGNVLPDASLPVGGRVKVLLLESNKTMVVERPDRPPGSAPSRSPFGGMRGPAKKTEP